MAENTKTVIYRCPYCLSRFIDVTIDKDKDGIYRCLKCGFNGTYEELNHAYDNFRARYKLSKTRLTLDEQRKM